MRRQRLRTRQSILFFPSGRMCVFRDVIITRCTKSLRARIDFFQVSLKRFLYIWSISSPEAAILQVCARNRDLWAKLKAHQKDGQISLAVETCSFQTQSPTHAQNQTGTRISWFRFWIRPEPLCFPTAGQGDAGSGDEIDIW